MKNILKAGLLLMVILVGFNTVRAQEFNFVNNLSVGTNNPDVAMLQTWLISNGFDIPAISSGAASKGYFGMQTKMAVMKMQAANGIPNTGYVGPLTRGRLNRGGQQGNALQVLSPNGNETWVRGTTQTISWSGAQGILNQSGSIVLAPALPPCADPANGPIRCMIAVRAPYRIASVNLNQKTYSWRVGDNLNNEQISDGKYRIQICSNDSSVCDTSDAYFDITSSVSGKALRVVSPNGGEYWTANTNQVIRWDATGANFSKVDIYLDEVKCPQANTVCTASLPLHYVLDKNIAASGAYGWITATDIADAQIPPGTWTVKVCEAGSTTNCDSSDNYFTILAGSSAGPLKITSPNGGEVWRKGTSQTITWTSPYYIRATYADVKLSTYYDPASCPAGYVCMPAAPVIYTLASNISINQNSLNWTVGNFNSVNSNPTTITPGKYLMQVCEVSSNNCDSSDQPFTITQ